MIWLTQRSHWKSATSTHMKHNITEYEDKDDMNKVQDSHLLLESRNQSFSLVWWLVCPPKYTHFQFSVRWNDNVWKWPKQLEYGNCSARSKRERHTSQHAWGENWKWTQTLWIWDSSSAGIRLAACMLFWSFSDSSTVVLTFNSGSWPQKLAVFAGVMCKTR